MRVNSCYCYYEEEHTFTWDQFGLIKAVSLHVHPCMYKMWEVSVCVCVLCVCVCVCVCDVCVCVCV